MASNANDDFVEAVENMVNHTSQQCAKCGRPIKIVNSLLVCEGPCGYRASLNLSIGNEFEIPEEHLKQIAHNLVSQRAAFLKI